MVAIHSFPNCAVGPSEGAKPRSAAELSAVPMTPELRQQITDQCKAISKVAMSLPSGPEKLSHLTELKSLLELLVPTPGSPVQSSPPAKPQTQSAAPTTSATQSPDAAISVLRGSGPIFDRILACGTLAHVGTEDALRALCEAVVTNDYSHQNLRAAAAEALKRNARHPTVEQTLVRTLVTEGAGVYHSVKWHLTDAVSLLQGLKDSAAIKVLSDAVINDRNLAAGEALIGLQKPPAIRDLTADLTSRALEFKSSRRIANEEAILLLLPSIRALTGVGDTTSQQALFLALLDAAAGKVRDLGPFAADCLAARAEVLNSIGTALKGVTDPSLISKLVAEGLAHTDEKVAIATCIALTGCKDSTAIEGLKGVVVSSVGIELKTAAAAALGEQDAVALAIRLANDGYVKKAPRVEIAAKTSLKAWLKGWLGF